MRINLSTPLSDDKEMQRRNEVILAAIEQYMEERMDDAYGRIHTDGSRSGGQPMPATEKAHKAIIEVLAEWGIEPRSTTPEHFAVATTEALCRAIDQQEDLRQPKTVTVTVVSAADGKTIHTFKIDPAKKTIVRPEYSVLGYVFEPEDV